MSPYYNNFRRPDCRSFPRFYDDGPGAGPVRAAAAPAPLQGEASPRGGRGAHLRLLHGRARGRGGQAVPVPLRVQGSEDQEQGHHFQLEIRFVSSSTPSGAWLVEDKLNK